MLDFLETDVRNFIKKLLVFCSITFIGFIFAYIISKFLF